MRSAPVPRLITPAAFDELIVQMRVSDCPDSYRLGNPINMVTQVVSGWHVLLRAPKILVWFTGERSFAGLQMETTDGPRWGLPFGDVVLAFQEAEAAAQAYLQTPDFQFLEAETLAALKTALPASLCFTALREDTYGNCYGLGVGVLFEKLTPDTLDEMTVVRLLAEFSCHPYFGQRLVRDLNAHGERITTVMPLFARTLPDVTAAFAPLGVRVSRTWPKPGAGHSNIPAAESSYEEFLAQMEAELA